MWLENRVGAGQPLVCWVSRAMGTRSELTPGPVAQANSSWRLWTVFHTPGSHPQQSSVVRTLSPFH